MDFLNDQQRCMFGELQQFGWELHAVSRIGHGHHAAVRSADGNDFAVICEDGLLADR